MVTGGPAVAAPNNGSMALPQGIPQGPCSPTEGSMAQRRSAENRRSNKPIMEKRRRARINNCLNELKTLILDAMKKDPARHSKLEKADILEMTVKHLENMQRQQVALATATDPTVINKFRAGFSECAGEVGRFPGLEPAVRRRLLQHLSACVGVTAESGDQLAGAASPPPASTSPSAPQQHMLILPSDAAAGTVTNNNNNGIFFSTGANGQGLQLVPTRLPNGDIALVLPSSRAGQLGQILPEQETVIKSSPPSSPSPSPALSSTTSTSPLPMLLPIPQRTASTASATSSASSSSFVSTSTSPVTFDRASVSSPPQTVPQNLSTAGSPSTSPASYPPSPSPSSCSMSMSYDIKAFMQPYMPEDQKPLALVTNRKKYEMEVDEEQPWRPW